MPQVTQRKQHSKGAVGYGGLFALSFPLIALAATQANTVVQTRKPIGVCLKILRATALLSGTVAGTCSFNVVLGTAAEAGVGTPDNSENTSPTTLAGAGTQLFAADQVLTMTADAPQDFNVLSDLWDVIWPSKTAATAGGELTLRTATNGAASGNLQVELLVRAYDLIRPHPYPSELAFSPANSIA